MVSSNAEVKRSLHSDDSRVIMPSKLSPIPSSSHPAIGTLIDDDSLKLVEILGVGGYGVVYRAEDTYCDPPASYAVKCLKHSHDMSHRQRQVHIREIALHQIASAHPNVATLHRVVEDDNFTYIIMEFAPDNDLFTQILNSCRYLGDDHLIRHVFLQLIDAVDYCHTMGIYHRDLKPENILCFEDGLRVAITDFGLATTDKISDEFRTGSVYHMSPECQGGDFAPTGTYSPMFNDIWSLGIILLNLATGRNPWKSATLSDPTFQAYLRDPYGFLPTVLPISLEANALLVRMLELDWRERMTIPELREALDNVSTFYSDGVVFEGSMARCPWEASMVIDQHHSSQCNLHIEMDELKSRWSSESASDIVFAEMDEDEEESTYDHFWTDYSSETAWATTSPTSIGGVEGDEMDESHCAPRSTLSTFSSLSSGSRPPSPQEVDGGDSPFALNRAQVKGLTIDTNCKSSRYYSNVSMHSSSTDSSPMRTAVEYDPYSSSFFLASPASPMKHSAHMVDCTFERDEEVTDLWTYPSELSIPSHFSSAKSVESETISYVRRSTAPSPDTLVFCRSPLDSPNDGLEKTSISRSFTPPPRPLSPAKKWLEKSTKMGLFSLKFFPRSSSTSSTPHSPVAETDGTPYFPGSFTSFTFSDTTPGAAPLPSWVDLTFSRTEGMLESPRDARRGSYFRSARHWFMPGKLFASPVAS